MPPTEAPMTNPEAAREMGFAFLAKHQAAMDARTKEVDNVFSKQQLNVDTMSKMLDDTTATLKRQREGRSNLPLMALGAGMMTSKGSFGEQLGAGVKAMVPAIQQQRGDDEDYQYKLAQMAMRRAGVENAPLQDKLAYLRALQVGDESTIRAIESGLIKVQGQTDKAGDKSAQKAAELEEKANNHAMQRAQDQVDKLGKDYFSTPQEREEELIRRYQQIARSLKVPEESITRFSGGLRSQIDPNKGKGMFTTPGDKPEDHAEAQKLGLPPKPVGYTYDSYPNPADRQKAYRIERENYEKETKSQQAETQTILTNDRDLERAENIMKKYPGITGRTSGVLPNLWSRYPTAATDELKAIFTKNQVYAVPQGQGAISNFERELFEAAKPRMDNLPDANKNLITVQRQIIADQLEKQKFINTYFGHYKTTMGANDAWADYARSKEGRAAFDDPQTGMVVPNPARITWQEYMKKKWGNAPQTHAEGGQHKSAAIHLGSEWDD